MLYFKNSENGLTKYGGQKIQETERCDRNIGVVLQILTHFLLIDIDFVTFASFLIDFFSF